MGIFPAPLLFIKVDTVRLSMYNRGLEAMPMISETWFLLVGLAGLVVGIFECLRGDLK